MFAAALVLFAVLMSVLIPIIVTMYSQWTKETTTIFGSAPYLPFWGALCGIVLITAFFAYAAIREYRINERKQEREKSDKGEIAALKSRLEILEKIIMGNKH